MTLPKEIPPVPINRHEPDTLNILLAGKHEGNLDTLMLLQVDMGRKKMTLLSVPRDIYFNSQKINSVYSRWGMEELLRELGIITGLKIDKFMVIDMYAFIEVIDLMGGVDVYLSEPLVDPTYKTFDEGKWGTLYYGRGEHHLSGVQVLRIARSRHTSSDFGRAERQQAILLGIRNKIKGMGLGDAGSIAKMISATLSKTESDISLKEAISWLARFKDYGVRTGAVLSTANVLTHKILSAEDEGGAETQNPEEKKCYRKLPGVDRVIEIRCAPVAEGQYVLMPKQDWNTVRYYIKKVFSQ
ncbi:LCP family protein [Candidatus Peregrinibacteria bacterium]|nr:LCP family protein [Candidatus Peregrinibacteria bacterium]